MIYRCPDCGSRYGGPLFGCPRCRQTKGLVMALNTCDKCTASFAVGIAKCPHCGSKDYSEEGSMPKITLHGGPSNAAADTDTSPDVSAAAPSGGVFSMPEGEHVIAAPSDGEHVASPEPEAEVKSFDDMTLAELRAEAEHRHLPTSGNKAELRKRIEQGE